MSEQDHHINADLIMQRVADRMMPDAARRRVMDDRARAATSATDFLSPDWSVLSRISVMTLREAVALTCGINRRYAWTTSHEVGDGEARSKIDAARGFIDYLAVKRGVTPEAKVPLDTMAEWARDAGLALPAGFPSVNTPVPVLQENSSLLLSDASNETSEARQARRYQLCIDANLKMPTNDYERMPRGIGKIAMAEGIERQSFVQDVWKHILRANSAKA